MSNVFTSGHAKVVGEYCDPKLDIAFLQLEEKLHEQAAVAYLGEDVT